MPNSSIFTALFLGLGIYLFILLNPTEDYGPGVLIPNEPLQRNDTSQSWQIGAYHLRSLAGYRIEGRVLSRHRYYDDASAALSPIDLALGWKTMSDSAVLDQLHIWQSGRYYHWRSSKELPYSPYQLGAHSSNTHMIPANKEIEDQLMQLRKGNLVRITGYLVEVKGPNQFTWKSSTTRNDTGGGACEVLYVQQVELIEPPQSHAENL